MGIEELKWHQLAHHHLLSQHEPILVHTVKLKPLIKAIIYGRMVSSSITHVASALVYSENIRSLSMLTPSLFGPINLMCVLFHSHFLFLSIVVHLQTL